LHIAVQYGQVRVVKCLLGHPAIDPNKVAPRAGAPLHLSAYNGDERSVALLLRHKAINPNVRIPEMRLMSPLMYAVQGGHTQVLHLLLQHPAVDVNMYSSLGYTALHIAAYSARVDVVERLVEHPDIQIDLPSATPSGVRPLEVAHVEAREDVIRALLKAGAAPMAKKQPV